jgi:hypothetical protein
LGFCFLGCATGLTTASDLIYVNILHEWLSNNLRYAFSVATLEEEQTKLTGECGSAKLYFARRPNV